MLHVLALVCVGLVTFGVLAAGASALLRTSPSRATTPLACAETWDGRPEAPPYRDCVPPPDTGGSP
jgi:hypothetical protein